MVMSGTGELTTLRLLRKLRLRNVGKVEKEEKIETPEEKKINGGLNGAGKYSKRRRSNVAVIIVGIVLISSFLFYCLLLNHSFQTNPNKITNCLKLFSLLQIQGNTRRMDTIKLYPVHLVYYF
jgi:hypothetical protein